MMTTNFASIMLVTMAGLRQLAKPLKPIQIEYLKALGVTADEFLSP
jgi:hypothetical protein